MSHIVTFIAVYWMIGGFFVALFAPAFKLILEKWWLENGDDDEEVKRFCFAIITYVVAPLMWPVFVLQLIVLLTFLLGKRK